MNSASRASSETESSSDRPVDSGIGWLLAIEGVVSVDGSTGYLSNFARQLEKQKVHRQIRENVRPGQILRQRDRRGGHSARGRNRARGNVSADIGGGVILVLTETGRQSKQQQALAGRDAPRFGLEAQVVDVE